MEEKIEKYIQSITDQESDLLRRLRIETHQKVLRPKMISGAYQGRLLSFISKLVQPQNILEIGTFTGYSALCLAEGLQPKGKLHTIDKNEELFDLQRKYFEQSPFKDNIQQYTGEAAAIIKSLNLKFDLVFLDADKKNYIRYFDLVFPKMNRGAVLITDNVLWYGKVVRPVEEKDMDTRVLIDFNTKLAAHPEMENLLLPVRDGILLSRKR